MDGRTPVLDLVRMIQHGWLIILMCVVGGVGGAVTVAQLMPAKYSATAVLTVEPLTGSSSGSAAVDMETERVVAGSTSVLDRAKQTLKDQTIEAVEDAVVVSIPKGSRILEFDYTAETPTGASDGANAVANAYSQQRVESAQKAVDDTARILSERIVELEAALKAAPAGSGRRALELQIASLQQQQAAATSATFSAGTLVSPATPPSSPSGPGRIVFYAAGCALGLLVGVLLAMVRYRMRLEKASEGRVLDNQLAGIESETRRTGPISDIDISAVQLTHDARFYKSTVSKEDDGVNEGKHYVSEAKIKQEIDRRPSDQVLSTHPRIAEDYISEPLRLGRKRRR